MTGLESLQRAVMKDISGNSGVLNSEGCNECTYHGSISKCAHRYCDKFKWIIERAKKYGERLGIPWENILDSWEEDRRYWYMNYYQECNQPQINSAHTRIFDTQEEFLNSLGRKEFRCPACSGVTTNPYECNSGTISGGKPCNWKVYGLFGDMGKGVFVYCKDKLKGETIFMPLAWEVA